MKHVIRITLLVVLGTFGTVANAADDTITIAHVAPFTGAYEAYTQQLHRGMELGFEYATDGTGMVLGKKIELIKKDTQQDPARARALLAAAYTQDDAVLAVGGVASGVALAMLPVAARFQKIFIPEGVANSITGEHFNRYIFRIGRNSSQDAISNAAAVAAPGVCIATLAQDYAFGRNGADSYARAAEKRGARILKKVFLPPQTTDFTAAVQLLFNAFKEAENCEKKYIFAIWAGKGNPMGAIQDLKPKRLGIELTTGGNILVALVAYKQFPGMEGSIYYYFESPDNAVNDWLVREHKQRYGTPPDFFTAQGMAQAMAIVAGLKKADSTDTESLIKAFEGLTFMSPKGDMLIRTQDHQALQDMYHFRIVVKDDVAWAVPELVDVIHYEEMDVPVLND